MSVNVNDLHTPASNDDLARFAFGDGRRGGLPRLQRKTE
jgi:hypothetical protein